MKEMKEKKITITRDDLSDFKQWLSPDDKRAIAKGCINPHSNEHYSLTMVRDVLRGDVYNTAILEEALRIVADKKQLILKSLRKSSRHQARP